MNQRKQENLYFTRYLQISRNICTYNHMHISHCIIIIIIFNTILTTISIDKHMTYHVNKICVLETCIPMTILTIKGF